MCIEKCHYTTETLQNFGDMRNIKRKLKNQRPHSVSVNITCYVSILADSIEVTVCIHFVNLGNYWCYHKEKI